MHTSFFKPAVFGILFGAAAFFMPFFLVGLFFCFLFMGGLSRAFGRRRFGPGGFAMHPAFTDKIRQMSDEEYATFKGRFQQRYGRCGHHAENHPFQSPSTQSNA